MLRMERFKQRRWSEHEVKQGGSRKVNQNEGCMGKPYGNLLPCIPKMSQEQQNSNDMYEDAGIQKIKGLRINGIQGWGRRGDRDLVDKIKKPYGNPPPMVSQL